MTKVLGPGRLLPLLCALIVLFLLYPWMVELGHVRFFRFVFIGVLALAAYSVGGTPRHLWKAIALGVPAALGQLAAFARPDGIAPLISTLLGLLFLAFITAVVFQSVVAKGRVTNDKIAGAISVYLLLGLLWALLYGIVATLDPDAFRVPADIAFQPNATGGEYAFIYYSFVTLTALGYGEITPATPWGQSLAWMEAVTGQLFIAILVARLVALHILHADRDP